VLIGFFIGKVLTKLKTLDEKIERLFVYGTILLFVGYTFQYLCPISKKLWTPTFAMVCCGFGALFLALFTIGIDKKGNQQNKTVTFFQVFGVNPLALYVISDLLLIPLSILPIVNGSTIQQVTYDAFSAILPLKAASLAWAILYLLINWAIGYWMYKKKIYIKL
jgi:predicted acyltransferase